MEQFFLIYLLSISGEVKIVFEIIAKCLIVIPMVFYGVTHVKNWIILTDAHGTSRTEEKDRFTKAEQTVRLLTIKLVITGAISLLVSAFFPTTENVLRAYALIEGSKVINAENAEHAAEAVGKRFDRFMDIIDKSVKGKDTPSVEVKDAGTGDQ